MTKILFSNYALQLRVLLNMFSIKIIFMSLDVVSLMYEAIYLNLEF